MAGTRVGHRSLGGRGWLFGGQKEVGGRVPPMAAQIALAHAGGGPDVTLRFSMSGLTVRRRDHWTEITVGTY
ncbi:hypothetical protein ACQEVY_12085 [Streptomyces sp. CA-288835]|uniref:hypothetical protein n=1 Tax=Streptomyces sp. CA-288835 TaxID=3240069 RepID=UPI003D8D84E2